MKAAKNNRIPSALELRVCAGIAPKRRGSALLIVIGTLALVSVFAAVYVSIGRTDRRAANALKTRVEQRDTSIKVSEYLAGIVGDDRLDAYVQYDAAGNPFARREITDAPYTDWTRRSEVASGNEHYLFTPTGRPFETTGLTADTDFRVANDPWLASTTPVFLGDPGDPFLGVNERPFSSAEVFDTAHPNAKNYLDDRDWLQISNFAPDGRPVNLFNLRPNNAPAGYRAEAGAASAVGGFDAEPGFGTSPRADGRPIRRMSNFLSLWKQAIPNDPSSLIQAFDPADEGVWVPGYNTPQDIGISGTDLHNIPAVWTMYQRFMYMPINQPFVTLRRDGRESTWADPDYPLYQYADTDGDGFIDARWFELASARDLNQGGLDQNRDDIEQLFENGDMRYFIAARAVDLSSMVSVNTATDLLAPPTVEYPMGLTPADIDLRRLLTMEDQAGDYTSVQGSNFAVPLSLQAAPRPYTTNASLANPLSWAAPPNGPSFARNVMDYNFYQLTARGSTGEQRDLDTNAPALLIGRYAYSALRKGLTLGGSLSNEYKGYDLESGGVIAQPTDLPQYEEDPQNINALPVQITQQKRVEQYEKVGRLDPLSTPLSWARATSADAYGSGLYGLDDLAELLTYHGLNDPDFTSRLERVVDGRFESPNTDALHTRRMGPMLSNRALTLDRMRHGQILESNDMRLSPSPDNRVDLSRIGEISRNSMALMALSPRKRMTTVSGFVPFSPDKRLNPDGTTIVDADTPMSLDARDIVPDLKAAIADPTTLFGIYSKALAGEIEDLRGQGWLNDPTLFDSQISSTLFYGHRGPELALRVAAHMAVNMKDMADDDSIPTVATVLLDRNRRNDLTNTSNFPADLTDAQPGNQWYRDYPGRASGLLFDAEPDANLAQTVLADNDLDVQRQAVNVYGMEATPVITEVSTFYVYTDHGIGDPLDVNDDFLTVRPRLRPNGTVFPIPAPEDLKRITIDGTDDIVANDDLLMKCVAFQLHNPWDVPISLGGDGRAQDEALTRLRDPNNANQVDTATDQFEFDYYIEWNGYFFKLAAFQQYYAPDMNPQENFRGLDQVITGTNNPAVDFPVNGAPIDAATYPDFTARNVVLAPGETRVFYAMANPRFDPGTSEMAIESKWRSALDVYGNLNPAYIAGGPDLDLDTLPDGVDGKGWTGPGQEWVINQFLPRSSAFSLPSDRIGEPVMVQPMNPQTGEYLDDQVVYDYFNTPGNHSSFNQLNSASGRQDKFEARLWKKITTPAEEENDPQYTNRITENLLHNDQLVDRISIGDVAQPLDANLEVDGTISFPEDYPATADEIAANVRNDNKGYSIVRWHTTTRRDSADPDYNDEFFEPASEEFGHVREWILGSRISPTNVTVDEMDAYSLNPSIEDFREVSGPASGDDIFADPATNAQSDYEVHLSLGDLFDVEPVVVTVALPPFRKTPGHINDVTSPESFAAKFGRDGTSILAHPQSGINVNIGLHKGDTISSNPASVPSFLGPDNMRPQINFDQSSLLDAPRLADLLLPWGIGPTYAPNLSLNDNDANYYPEEWITPPEAFAIALGYEQPVASGLTADNIWANIWADDANREQRFFDDGHLALDRFVPYLNATIESPPAFTLASDIRRGLGVPMALGVVDRARAIARLDRVNDPINPSASQQSELELTRATFGTININTAPIEVLRMLAGLTPSRSSSVTNGATPEKDWWGSRAALSRAEIPDNTIATNLITLAENPDIASAIVAYRDRLYATPNTAARPETAGTGVLENAPMFLSPSAANLGAVAQNMIGEIPFLPATPASETMDRSSFTGIDALRTTPGFGSIGELLAVQLDPDFSPSGATPDTTRWGMLKHLSIQQLGLDARAQGTATVPGGEATLVPQVFENDKVGSTVDDYAERLALADSVMNLISVRSDYYAVWFVLQGYRQSDVANLNPEDPLIPTLHKRFIMVIDRSNVVEAGDKPRIVLLKEVPL